MESNKTVFLQGMHDGIPIGMGYIAVAFSLGITARDCGFGAFQGFLSGITTYASAGQFIAYTLYAANATLFQLVVVTLITNARYLLMGFALNQRLREGTPLWKRMLCGAAITDEIFGITIARPGYVNPFYSLGALAVAAPMWSCGISLGIVMGNLLPARLVSALSVALFGMFLAVIIPPSRKDKIVGACVAISFAASYAAATLPGIRDLPAGNRTILLTVVISAVAALLFPVKKGEEEGQSPDRERAGAEKVEGKESIHG
jgi:predicted branched-subunit amino acid permease